jgi:hypothetical protein
MNLRKLLILMIFLVSIFAVRADLKCQSRVANCLSGEVDVFHFASDYTHGENATTNSFTNPFKVCCNLTNSADLNNNCNMPFNVTILQLEKSTDSHAELPGKLNYNLPVCLGSNTVKLVCGSREIGMCPSSEACIVSVMSVGGSDPDTNWHVANCTDGDTSTSFNDKICCWTESSGVNNTMINGTVWNITNGQRILGANISFYYPYNLTKELVSTTTDINGFYQLNVSKYSIDPYVMLNGIAKAKGFGPLVRINNTIRFNKTTEINFTLSPDIGCLADCTNSNDIYHLCDPQCEGINGCSFNPETKSICTNPRQVRGAKIEINENATHVNVTYCCNKGTNMEPKRSAEAKCKYSKHLLKYPLPIEMNSNSLNMVIVSCSK